jgi:hypothetical protein
VQSADQDVLRGHLLSNGIDANGRLIAFVYLGDHPGPDGMAVFVDTALVDQSLNAVLLAAGHAHPAFYATLPADLRTHLAAISRAARAAQPPVGLWPRSTADPDGPATIADLGVLEGLVIWPKLFRRIVPYLASGFLDFDSFDSWLRADPSTAMTNCSSSSGWSGATCTMSSVASAPRSSSRSGPRTSSSAPTHQRGAAAPAQDRSPLAMC